MNLGLIAAVALSYMKGVKKAVLEMGIFDQCPFPDNE